MLARALLIFYSLTLMGCANPIGSTVQPSQTQDDACLVNSFAPERTESVQVDGESLQVELVKNNLRGESAQVYHDGESAPLDEALTYEGRVVGHPDSWARLTLVDGEWEGVVSRDGNELEFLGETPEGISGHCATHDEEMDMDHLAQDHGAHFDGSGGVRRVELYVLTDHLLESKKGNNLESYILSQVNTMDGVFRNAVNVGFEVIGIGVVSDNWTFPNDASHTLGQVAALRLSGEIPLLSSSDAVVALTGLDPAVSGNKTTLGIAWEGGVCTSNRGVGLVYHSPYKSVVADNLIHEMGHLLGSGHRNQGYRMQEFYEPNVTRVANRTKNEINSELATKSCIDTFDPSDSAGSGLGTLPIPDLPPAATGVTQARPCS